mmetsp:Transcript_4681/g.14272  ORF Transcript_4681/g.14272 Transcript_4681/m.14272 type:complete len:207 (-) Transcript_4681:1010-1630(-)
MKSAGRVAESGMMATKGKTKSMDIRNSAPHTKAAKPVRAPATMPVSDSTKVVMLLEPTSEPKSRPQPSMSMALLMARSAFLTLPAPMPDFIMMVDSVPKESNISTKMKVQVTSQKCVSPTAEKSSLPARRWLVSTRKGMGSWCHTVKLVTESVPVPSPEMPQKVVRMMAQRMPARTPKSRKSETHMRPSTEMRAAGLPVRGICTMS